MVVKARLLAAVIDARERVPFQEVKRFPAARSTARPTGVVGVETLKRGLVWAVSLARAR